MIRPFNLRDLGLVRRLGERGMVFQTQAALTQVPHPVRHALVNMFAGGGSSTFIWKSKSPQAAAYIQLSMVENQPNAYLASIGLQILENENSSHDVTDENIWQSLLEQLVVAAGKRGVHNLIAEAPEDGPELQLLRRAGFVIFTRQDIWINDQPGVDGPAGVLVERQPVDDWDISVLYANIVPGMIQSVEPGPPLESGQNWVLREDGELTAYVHLCTGPIGSWMRLFIHPNANTRPKDIIGAALHAKQPTSEHPVYCCVRRYQSWLLNALEKAGFRPWGSQAVMVKHIAQQVETPAPALKNMMEPKAVPGSSTFIQGLSGVDNRNGH